MMDSDEYSINKALLYETCSDAKVVLQLAISDIIMMIPDLYAFSVDESPPIMKMKDFLTIYNRMAEMCFNHCIDNFNCRELTTAEEKCIENCSSKSLGVNQKLMMTYIEVQPDIMNKRVEELQRQQNILDALNDSNSNT